MVKRLLLFLSGWFVMLLRMLLSGIPIKKLLWRFQDDYWYLCY
nr:MAG TPA: hypothetical protein [Microviridae sp.]